MFKCHTVILPFFLFSSFRIFFVFMAHVPSVYIILIIIFVEKGFANFLGHEDGVPTSRKLAKNLLRTSLF